MPVRKADAVWEGGLKGGHGKVALGSGAWSGPYSFASRFADGQGSNPEELIAAAHAGCFSMALSFALAGGGHPPERLDTSARVAFQAGAGITGIHLAVRGRVPGLDAGAFREAAEQAKANCPVSKALAGVPEITLDAELEE